MPYTGVPEHFNMTTYLIDECNLAKGRKDKVALYYYNKGQAYTYQEVSDQVNKYANYLLDCNISKGQRIGFLLHDCPEFIFLFLAAIKVGIVPAIINTKMSNENIESVINNTDLKIVFTDEAKINNLSEETKERAKLIDDAIEQAKDMDITCEAYDSLRDDIAFILFTSGSSGLPKGVMHYQSSIVSCIEGYGNSILCAKEDDVIYSHSKLCFAFGLGPGLYYPMAFGATTIVNDDDNVYDIYDIIQKYHVTKFYAVPSIYNTLLMLAEDGKDYMAGCKLCMASGEYLPKRIETSWKERFGLPIYQGIGSTEMLHSYIHNSDEHHKLGSLGYIVPNFAYKIVDEEGNEVKANEVGTLLISGGSMMAGYFGQEEKTKSLIKDGYFNTGDRCSFDEEGFIWYSGRGNDAFKLNGEWKSAEEIEEIVLLNENVVEVIIQCESKDNEPSVITAYIVAKEGADYEDIAHSVKRVFFMKRKRNLCPTVYNFVEAIPRGTTGKAKRGSMNLAKVIKTVEC
ncbi:MAG: AMP-binding protein [Clostridium sp.]|nr:AMP-binding protein [Clostridium sp.]